MALRRPAGRLPRVAVGIADVHRILVDPDAALYTCTASPAVVRTREAGHTGGKARISQK